MGHPVGGALRAVRGLALALVVVGIASTAHLAGGGDLPPGLLLAGVVVAAAFAAHAATSRRLTLPAALGLLGAGQVALHAAFTVLAVPAGAGTVAAASRPSGLLHVHAHGGPHSGLLLPVDAAASAGAGLDAAAAAADPAAGSTGAAMLLAHVLATLVAAVVLAGADRSLWLLVAWLAPLVAVLAAAASAVVPRLRRRPVGAPRTGPRSLLLARRSLRRGPPRLVHAPA